MADFDVFISYARDDQPIALLLADRLNNRGLTTWFDLDLRVGQDWASAITTALESAAVVVVIVTPNSITSQWVETEWSRALRRSQRVIPVLASGASFADLPVELATIQAVDLNSNMPEGIEQIADYVASLKQSEAAPAAETVDIQAIVEDIVERKLARLGVGRTAEESLTVKEDPDLVFVVTSFDTDMEPAFEAIDAAAKAVGLRAERVKDAVGDYRITDKMLSSIQQAGLLVVDLTHERPNVYFELGYARGLGKTVITILKAGTQVHFDVQDWPYIAYVDSRPLERDLTERLRLELQKRSET